MTDVDVAREFEPAGPSLSEARLFLRQSLGDLLGDGDGGSDCVELLLMAANELATNAVLHARTEFTVRVLVEPTSVRIEVADLNSRMPQPCMAPGDATSGRGLAIVDGSGLQWGMERQDGGKTVWLEAARTRPARPA